MWRIEYNSNAAKALRRLPRNIAGLIRRKIESLAVDPYAPNNNVKPLAGRPGHRLRVGGWRVIYELRNEAHVIHVLTIAPRGGVYR